MDFLTQIFGASTGYLCIVTIIGERRTEHIYSYPDDLPRARADVKTFATKTGCNVYFYPVLFDAAQVDTPIVAAPVVAVDLDMVVPELVTPRPDFIVESSGGRFQAYWYRNGYGSEFAPLSVNGPITGDNKLKRLPGTRNWKYSSGNNPNAAWIVKTLDLKGLDTFSKVSQRHDLTSANFEYLFDSGDRYSLARFCARLGLSASEVFLTLQASLAGLGAEPGSDTWVSIETLYRDALTAVSASGVPSLLTTDEIKSRANLVDTESFVARYCEWATSCTDAPRQYHVAGALMILSALLAPHIRLPTQFTEFKVNLWFIILAETTLTRKTTAMDMAINLAECVEPDLVMTNEGTAEGFTSALAERDGNSSIFHKDEISGFMREANEKRYMSGILETLTRFYDGGKTKRTLRKQTIKVEDPYFMIMCGGIKSATIDLLTTDNISSGFLPRFLMVCGWTNVEDLNPIGPPDDETSDKRDKLISYLEALRNKFATATHTGKQLSKFKQATSGQPVTNPIRIKASADAWDRIRLLESDARRLGLSSDNPNAFGPMFERAMNSIIKVAVLLAADRAFRQGCGPTVEVEDIILAISYSDVWIESMYEVVSGIEDKPTKDELVINRIEKYVRGAIDDGGVLRSKVMQRFRLTAKQMNEYQATLIERNLIVSGKVGRAEVYRIATREA
jgi:hypothetical protein